jgi:peptidase E
MIFLNFSKMHELNAFNSFAKTNLDKKNICFLPSAQDDFEKDEITQEIILEKEDEEPEENSEESSENTERVEDNLIDEN